MSMRDNPKYMTHF